MTHIIDSSALLAVIMEESGAEQMLVAGRRFHISVVNLGEVFTKVVERGGAIADVEAVLAGLPVRVRSFRAEDAAAAARLRPATKHRGLSFGDRACLALADKLDLPVLTADRGWAGLELGIDIQLIR